MKFVVYVRRASDSVQYYQKYLVDVDPKTSVLEVLFNIREAIDSTVAFRYACRMGICGICAVKINGRPALACTTKIGDLNTTEVYIEPLSEKVIKDLVVEP
ncbi:MAG: 2Fe-2S iron-sulfur cluster-binding protein [Pyrobaculum sp.]